MDQRRRQLLAGIGGLTGGMIAGCLGSEPSGAAATVDVADGAHAIQEAVNDVAADPNRAKLVVTGGEGEWNHTVSLPSNFTLEFEPGVTVTSSMTEADADTFDGGGAALITNQDHDEGNTNITIRGGHIDFANVEGESPDGDVRWGPVWLVNCTDSLFEGITVENVIWRYGVVFTDCERSVMKDCVARNIGYDGITLRGTCRHVDVYRCEAYEMEYGPGIQAAPSLGGHGTGGHDVNFIHCRTPENIVVHGVRGGATAATIHGCAARRVSMIQEVNDFRITNCDVDNISFSALNGTLRNGRVDGCTMGERYGDELAPTATILWTFGGTIENVTFSNCTAQTDGNIRHFVEGRLVEAAGTVRHIDYVNCTFDGAGATDAVFIDHTPDGAERYQESIGSMESIRIHSSKLWNLDYVVRGPIDGLRIRDTELVAVDEWHDGQVRDLDTRDNDAW